MSNSSGIDMDALAKTFTELMTESLLLRGVNQHNKLKHADLCEGLSAIKDRWELLFKPALDLRSNRDGLLAPFTAYPGAENVIDAALFGMESMLEVLRQDFYSELQRIKPLIVAANTKPP